MNTRHVLLIPTEGLPELLHSDYPIDIAALLAEKGGTGNMVTFTLKVNGTEKGLMSVLVGREPSPNNSRAHAALLHLTDVHMTLHGPVAFQVPPDVALELVGDLP